MREVIIYIFAFKKWKKGEQKKALLLLDENYHNEALKNTRFFPPLVGVRGSVDKLNKVVFLASRVGSSHLPPLSIRKQAWMGESVQENITAKQKATDAERKASCKSLASFSCRFTAVEPSLFGGGGPDSGPGHLRPLPGCQRQVPPAGHCWRSC